MMVAAVHDRMVVAVTIVVATAVLLGQARRHVAIAPASLPAVAPSRRIAPVIPIAISAPVTVMITVAVVIPVGMMATVAIAMIMIFGYRNASEREPHGGCQQNLEK